MHIHIHNSRGMLDRLVSINTSYQISFFSSHSLNMVPCLPRLPFPQLHPCMCLYAPRYEKCLGCVHWINRSDQTMAPPENKHNLQMNTPSNLQMNAIKPPNECHQTSKWTHYQTSQWTISNVYTIHVINGSNQRCCSSSGRY